MFRQLRSVSYIRWFSALTLLGGALVTACAHVSDTVSSRPTVTSLPTPVVTATFAVPTRTVRFTAADGVGLVGTLYGQGNSAIVLSNQGDNDSQLWAPVAQQLAAHGYLVLSYAYRDTNSTPDHLASFALIDARAAFAFIRTQHITQVIGMGSSLGGLLTVKLAVEAHLNAMVVLSAPLGFQDVQISDADLRVLALPKVFVTSEGNEPFAANIQHMFAVAPQPKEQRVYPGSDHGLAIFSGDSGEDLLTTILRFVQMYAPAR